MPSVLFIDSDGERYEARADRGISLMEAARNVDVPGIPADCGGACACATCHVIVAAEWFARTGGPNALEEGMLEDAPGVTERSRLACQITITDELDGLVCRVPPG